jgi:membrane protein
VILTFFFALVRAAKQWYRADTGLMAAALAYYGLFSIAPTLVLGLAVASFFLGDAAAQGILQNRMQEVVGKTVARTIEETLRYAHLSGAGWWATLLSIGFLLFGAVRIFAQLQQALNLIWEVRPRADRSIWAEVQARALSFVLVMIVCLLLLASLIASTLLGTVGSLIHLPIPGWEQLWEGLHWGSSLALLTLLFALVFKVLPDAHVHWADVWVGAGLTAVLFTVGSYLIGLYLGTSAVTSAYGAAGSLVALLLWVYYSAQIVLFGGEFTQAFARLRGRPIEPTAGAEYLPGTHSG